MRTVHLAVMCACAWLIPFESASVAQAPTPSVATGLAAHEWGTFTSFSGSDGVPVGFAPDNADLPGFVYRQIAAESKGERLRLAGTISMETPVIFFYTTQPIRLSVGVDFPSGWITDWYPYACKQPSASKGHAIAWNVQLVPGEPPKFARDKDQAHYYAARRTDAAPLLADVPAAKGEQDPHGGKRVEAEKFLFYRGVGTFKPLVSIRALPTGEFSIKNNMNDRVAALFLIRANRRRVAFKSFSGLEAGKEFRASLPDADGDVRELASAMTSELKAVGLYDKEAQAMVETWQSAWFEENGTRLLYLVPRETTDRLLPLSIEPKPGTIVRVLVGRHDFLTVEQEAKADRQVERIRAARLELKVAESQMLNLGRFSAEARTMAERRLAKKGSVQDQ